MIAAHEGLPLPPDVTFDGTGYWDMTGAPLAEHPLASAFVARFLAVHDAGVAVVNALHGRVTRVAAEEETSADAAVTCCLDWPSEEDAEAACLTLPALPLGLATAELGSAGGGEESVLLPLPPRMRAPWWVQQARAATWLDETLKTVTRG